MTQQSTPWVGGAVVDAGGWRALMRGVDGDGIVNDGTDSSLRVSATGGDKTVQVAAGEAHIQGVHYRSDAIESLSLETGTAPSGSQYRIDRVVLRYDASESTPNDRVQLAVKVGTPAAAGAATVPSLTRSTSGVWEHALATITRGPGDIAVTNAMIRNEVAFCCPVIYVGTYAQLPDDAPAGCLAVTFAGLYKRVTTGTFGWYRVDDPPWTDLTVASGLSVVSTRVARCRIRAGMIEFAGSIEPTSGTFTNGTWRNVGTVPSTIASHTEGGGLRTKAAILRAGATTGDPVSAALSIDLSTGGTATLAVYPFSAGGRILDLDGMSFGPTVDPFLG